MTHKMRYRIPFRWVKCPQCHGDQVIWYEGDICVGDDPAGYETCDVCHGTGFVTARFAKHWHEMNDPLVYSLPELAATGRVIH